MELNYEVNGFQKERYYYYSLDSTLRSVRLRLNRCSQLAQFSCNSPRNFATSTITGGKKFLIPFLRRFLTLTFSFSLSKDIFSYMEKRRFAEEDNFTLVGINKKVARIIYLKSFHFPLSWQQRPIN